MDHLRIFGVLLAVLQAASWTHAQLRCYNDVDAACGSTPVLDLASPADCCLGEGFWFDALGGEGCVPCQVYGWMTGQPPDGNLTLVVEEQPAPIVIQVGFVKGFQLTRTLTVTDSPITADSVDYTLNTRSVTARASRLQAVELSITVDSVALEGNETFELTLEQTTTLATNDFLLDKLTVIIQDSDTVNIRFLEDDYSGSEAQGRATVTIERTSAIANPVSVRIVPMTYTDYLSEGFSPLTGIGDRAEADDFQTNPIEVTFDPSADAFMDVMIQITQDTTNEPDEDFVVVLELVDTINPGVVFGRMASIVRIRDDDTIRIGFEMANYRFVEGSGTQTVRVIKEDDRLTEQTFDIGILVQPGNIPGLEEAVQGLDFNISTTTFEFLPENQEYTVDVLVLEDNEMEGPEAFKLTVDLPGAVAPGGNPSAIVVIEDINATDVVNCYTDTFCNGTATRALNAEECCFGDGIAFQPILNATCQICVVVGWIGNTEIAGVERGDPYPVNVGYTKGSQVAGTITFDVIQDPVSIGPEDVTGVTHSITVTPGTLSSVEFVLVVDDISQEDAEIFELRLDPTTQIGSTVFLVDVLQVAIIDGDVACFQFTAEMYQDAENTRQVDIVVEVLQGIATPVDLLVTPLEYDDFDPTPNFPVVPPLDPTRPNRAVGDDFNTSAFVITIPATEQPEQVIFSVELFDDDINEAEQVFVLVMELLDALTPVDVDLTPRNACLVVIIDDDTISVEFQAARYIFTEGNSTQEIVITANLISEQTLELDATLTPGGLPGIPEATLGIDYLATFGLLQLGPSMTSITIPIEPLADGDDEVIEGFQLQLAQGSNSPPLLLGSNSNADVLILDDNDVVQCYTNSQVCMGTATFESDADTCCAGRGFSYHRVGDSSCQVCMVEVQAGFQQIDYTVNEQSRSVVLNIVKIGTSLQPVTVLLSTADGTALDSSDYTAQTNTPVTFQTSDLVQQISIAITNDATLEDAENFDVVLTAMDPSAVQIVNGTASISIIDDDRVRIGFEPTSYTASESDGVVNFEIVKRGDSDIPVSVQFSTADGTATDGAICSGDLTIGDYRLSYVADGDVWFSVSAVTTGWVAVGFSIDAFMPDTDIVLGASDGTDGFINDRYATGQFRPPVDASQDISEASFEHVDGTTTINFTRPCVTGDSAADIDLNQCLHFLYAYGGLVDDFTDPNSIQYHFANRGAALPQICIPDSCCTGGNHDYEAIENQVVTFDASTIRQTVAVSIREDDISEPQEFFFGQLSTPDPSTGVELFDTTANASIVDDAILCYSNSICGGAASAEINPEACCRGSGFSYQTRSGADCRVCIVFGWSDAPAFTGAESASPYGLGVEFLKGGSSSDVRNIPFGITSTTISASEEDFEVLNPQGTVVPGLFTVSVQLNEDLIANEPNETFSLRINPNMTLRENEFVVDTIEVTITDRTVLCYSDSSCGGTQSSAVNAEDCCTGSGFSFQRTNDSTCQVCIVFGWRDAPSFTGAESADPYGLGVAFLKGGRSPGSRNIPFVITSTLISASEEDFEVPNPQGRVVPGPLSGSISVLLNEDLIANEPNEDFILRINPNTTLRENEFVVDTIRITITDQTVLCYTDSSCGGNHSAALNAENCCTGSGFSFQRTNISTCQVCIVIGWEDGPSFTAPESSDPYTLGVVFLKGGDSASARNITFDVRSILLPSVDADDFQLNTQGELVLQPSTTVEVSVTLNTDLVALESDGLFNLRINAITTLRENEFIMDLLRVVIIDQDVLNIVFGNATYSVAEGNTIEILLFRGGGVTAAQDAEVTINPVNLTLIADIDEATPSVDYTGNFGLFLFPSLASNISLQFTAMADTTFENTEVAQLEAVFGSSTSVALVFISDSFVPQLVQFEFVEFDYVTPEGQGVQVMVRRRGSIATSVTLQLTPREYSNGVPATAGRDFNDTAVFVTFEPSSTPEEILSATIPVFEDGINEAQEVFAVDLELVSSGASNIVDLQGQNTTLIRILDDDSISIEFTTPEFTARESVGSVTIQLVKANSQLSEQSFELIITATDSNIPGIPNAILGEDYILPGASNSLLLPFPPEQQEVEFEIDIISGDAEEGVEAFQLEMSASATSANFQPGGNAEVFISDLEDTVMCYRQDNCGGNFTAESTEDCCRGDGFSFRTADNPSTCQTCVVFGWIDGSQFVGEERARSYDLLVGNIKGDLGRDLSLSVESTEGTAVETSDFILSTVMLDFTAGQSAPVSLALRVDNIALEVDEDFELLLTNTDGSRLSPAAENEFFLDTITVTINDTERVVIQFTEDDYRALEHELVVPVTLSREMRIATPVTVRVTPRTCGSAGVSCEDPAEDSPEDRRDYATEPLTVTFEPNVFPMEDAPVGVNITDDEINEAEEIFIVTVEVVASVDNSRVDIDRRMSLCRIIDNDLISIGFTEPEYSFDEIDNTFMVITLIKENGRVSEQLFEYSVTASEAPPEVGVGDATFRVDYRIGLGQSPMIVDDFRPEVQQMIVQISILDDSIFEGTEIALLTVSNTGNTAQFVLGTNPSTVIRINDNDGVVVGFTQTFFSVEENVQQVELCLTITEPSNISLIISNFFMFVRTRPGTADSSDYEEITFNNDPLTVFSAATAQQCFDVTIFDDTVTERTERFTVVATLDPPNTPAVVVSPDTVTIEIRDNEDPGIIQLVNDTVIADPLMTIPINSNSPNQENLCYELHGAADNYFSLVSDQCTAVNAHYAAVENHTSVNIIDAITVRAVDSTNECQNIRASLDNCTADIGGVPLAVSSLGYSSNGISVRRFRNRIRISVPNCNDTSLVMWVLCTEGPFLDPVTDEEFSQRSIRFVIARGLNLNERSHGLLGQFWNIPTRVVPFNGTFRDSSGSTDNAFVVSVMHPDARPRSFVAFLEPYTWDLQRTTCLYAGNRQGGPIYEVETPNDPVIQGVYTDYIVSGEFETGFSYSHFEESECN